MKNDSCVKIDISTETILKIILIIFGVWFLYVIRDVLVVIFVAFVLSSAMAPLVDRLEKVHLPRSLVTMAIYILFFSGVFYLFSLLAPAVSEQMKHLANNLPEYGKLFGSWQEKISGLFGGGQPMPLDRNKFLLELSNKLGDGGVTFFARAGSFFQGFVSFIAVFSLSFYLSIQRKSVGAFLKGFIPRDYKKYAVKKMDDIQEKMGHWLVGQVALSVLIGVMVYIGLRILEVPYALLLAIFAGIFEVVPYIGPTISAVAGVLVASSLGPVQALLVLGMYVVVQQLENHLVVPLVMKQAIGLNPVAIIIAILIGIKVAGPFGLILAIPLVAVLSVFISDFVQREEEKIENL